MSLSTPGCLGLRMQYLEDVNSWTQEMYVPFSPETLRSLYQAYLETRTPSLDYLTLYIHTPYCLQRCSYCMYQTKIVSPSEASELLDKGIDSLEQQFQEVSDTFNSDVIQAIYFGGGSPTLLSSKQLSRLLSIIDRYWTINKTSQNMIAFEGHPSQISQDRIKQLTDWGVNRISLGLQSLDPEVLRAVNRVVLPKAMLLSKLEMLSRYVDRYNVDLMYGLQKQTAESFLTDVKELLSYKLPHLTLYGFNNTLPKTRAITSEQSYQTQAQKVFLTARSLLDSYPNYAFTGTTDAAYSEFNCIYKTNSELAFRFPYNTAPIYPYFNSILGFSMERYERASSWLTPLGLQIVPSHTTNQIVLRSMNLLAHTSTAEVLQVRDSVIKQRVLPPPMPGNF